MTWWVAAYPMAHFLAYALKLRRDPLFSHEHVIFLYHAASALLLAGILLGWLGLAPASEHLAVALVALGLHGIYSLSFLELWSLSEGSYSLGVLRRPPAADASTTVDTDELERIGEGKKTHRLDSLGRLHLVRRCNARMRLTRRGAAVAHVLNDIAWLANVREVG